MDADSARAGLDDPHRIEAARRLLPQSRGEALDRLAALSARLLGAAHAQITLIADAPVAIAPAASGDAAVEALTVAAFEHAEPLVLAHASQDGVASFLGVPIELGGARVGVLSVHDREPRGAPGHARDTR